MSTSAGRRIKSVNASDWRAILYDLNPLFYSDVPAPDTDVAAHVRAASSVRRWANRLVIISDDTNAVALQDEQSVSTVLLPPGNAGHRTFGAELGNKKYKLDLEASVVLPDGRLLALGSGSTERRERLVLINQAQAVQVIDAHPLYALLRRTRSFSGSELNIEGAVIIGDTLRLFQRGNGAVVAEQQPLNATADIDVSDFVKWLAGDGDVPHVDNIVQYDLGHVGGVAWTFTDAAVTPTGRVVFTAAAEGSADTYNDGEVRGSMFGELLDSFAKVAIVCDPAGQQLSLKLEGIEPDAANPAEFSVVVDMDRPHEPARLGRLEVKGFG
jgi:hypothetical protein